jgi:predicted MFS family arabinose efflux permease
VIGAQPWTGTERAYRINHRTQLALLVLVAGAAIYARTMISPLQEAIRAALALTDNQMAILQGPALALPLLVGAAPLGLAIDRYSRVRLLMGCGIFIILGSAMTALGSSFQVLLAGRCAVGLAAPATAMAVASLVADLFPPAQRGRVNMLVTVGQTASMAAAFALGGFFLASFGTGLMGWRRAMLALGSPLLAIAILIPLLSEPARTDVSAPSPSLGDSISQLWQQRFIVGPILIGFALVAAMADGAALVWIAPTLSRRFSLSPDRIGNAMGVLLLVSGTLGPVIGGAVADACQRTEGPHRTLAALAALTILSVPAAFFAIAPSATASIFALVLFLTLGTATGVIVTTLFTIVIPNELRGLCLSAMWTSGALLGLGVAPIAVSVLSNLMGGPGSIGTALAIICIICTATGAGCFAVGKRSLSKLTQPSLASQTCD